MYLSIQFSNLTSVFHSPPPIFFLILSSGAISCSVLKSNSRIYHIIRLVRRLRHVRRDGRLDRLVRADAACELCFDRRVLQALFQYGLLCHLVKIRLPWAERRAVCLAIFPCVFLNVVDAHDVESVAAVFRVKYRVVHDDCAAILHCWDVLELRLESELVFERVVLVHFVRLDVLDLAAAIGEVDQPLIPELELALERALVLVRDEIRLSERRVRLDAELRRLHHRAEEAVWGTQPEILIRAHRRKYHAGEPLGCDDGGQGFCDLPLHRDNEVFHRALRLDRRALFRLCLLDCSAVDICYDIVLLRYSLKRSAERASVRPASCTCCRLRALPP